MNTELVYIQQLSILSVTFCLVAVITVLVFFSSRANSRKPLDVQTEPIRLSSHLTYKETNQNGENRVRSTRIPAQNWDAGASSFLGTISTVPIQYALCFVSAFYERFMNGATVAEALIHARQQAPQQNPFWLFYILHGKSFATVKDVLK
ncbi:MAG: hypothetical protein CV045_09895 [Cyanobacteria bacterium M5B4]|nr:MAG: hypothetical protein CV045_09895 [Cyanobacteria bacterium M5B4]